MKNMIDRQSALTKSSTEVEIKAYFKKVLELKQSGEKFPVNLELVWPLVYSEKGKAVRALTSEFIESVDYQVFTQNGKNPVGGRPSDDYSLSVPCMEFFIARKVRPVFEVYRQVFHRAAEQAKPLSTLDILELTIKSMREQRTELAEIRQDVQELKARAQTHPSYFTVMGYAALHRISVNLRQAAAIGKRAADLCKMLGFPMDRTPDPRFGEVNMYPEEVLRDMFDR